MQPLACLGAVLAAVLTTPPAEPGRTPALADLQFMSGAWRAEVGDSIVEEHYSTPFAGTMMGMFRWTREGGTSLTEHIVIEERDDGVHMFLRHFHPGAVPWEQEADGPMRFRLTSSSEGRAVFEDAERLFPRQIVYERTQPDTLLARLEGRRESGEDRTMEFTFRSTDMSTAMKAATESLSAAGQSLGYNGGLTIALPVSDLQAAIDFYQDVVGFKLQYKVEDMGWCELTTSVPHVNIGLSQVEKPNPGGQTPVFGVRDIDRARATLEKRGVRFDGETVEIPGLVKLATFKDPDGNALKLSQSLSE